MVPTTSLGPPAPPTAVGEPVFLERFTRDGRKLTYELTVIQQPERARACGSGPKSSADRRPVDPPPVVQLKIFEGPSKEQAKDVTFCYNAEFFLYAQLEHARQIANGRVPGPSSNTPPVLTGMPVSSMSYLDRPTEAGYFLFPDLSVRHEGRYRLTFSLYEETKDDRDKDMEPNDVGAADEITGPTKREYSLRLSVRTDEFNVYSAKKFPGLAESTLLSRTVAEQGCRVRIRRDVRMRRRNDQKHGREVRGSVGGNADGTSEAEYARRKATPSPAGYRGRSSSDGSMDKMLYGAPAPMSNHQRRPSGVEYAPPPPGFAPDPHASRHLTYGGPHNGPYPSQQTSPLTPPPAYPTPASLYGPRKSSYSSYQEPSPKSPYAPQYSVQGERHNSYPAPPNSTPQKLEPDIERPAPKLPSILHMLNPADSAPAQANNPSDRSLLQYRSAYGGLREDTRNLPSLKGILGDMIEHRQLPGPEQPSRKRTFDESFASYDADAQRYTQGRREEDSRASMTDLYASVPRYSRACGDARSTDFRAVMHR